MLNRFWGEGRRTLWDHAKLLIRNLGCAAIAVILIACGAVRRARAKGLASGVISGIYFHKPNRRLFARCVRWLRKNGYTFISEKDLISFIREHRPVPRGAVWLSFDDGAIELFKDVLPIVEEQEIPVTLFIPTGIVAGDGLFPWISMTQGAVQRKVKSFRPAMTVEDLRRVALIPKITIGSHTVNHRILPSCSDGTLDRELRESKQMLESWLTTTIDTFSYPNGEFDDRSGRVLDSNRYAIAVTTENDFVRASSDPWRIPRFSVADDIFFPEAICNMVGVWQPVIKRLKHLMRWGSGKSQ